MKNNGTLIGGYAEGVLSSYEASANVTADTNGLKEAVKGSDGSFSFKARTTGTDSGIKDQTLQKAVKNHSNCKKLLLDHMENFFVWI